MPRPKEKKQRQDNNRTHWLKEFNEIREKVKDGEKRKKDAEETSN